MGHDVDVETTALEVDYSPSDADAESVVQMLRGATRSVDDPDIELAILLTKIVGASEADLRSALASLVADARDA